MTRRLGFHYRERNLEDGGLLSSDGNGSPVCAATLDACLRVATLCRTVLEIVWPLMHDAYGDAFPALAGSPSHDCCVHSAFLLSSMLEDEVPGMRWSVVGGAPSGRNRIGGFSADGLEGRPHTWVVGALARLPGAPVLLADVTADQFGGPPVLVGMLPIPGYFANTPPRMMRSIEENERETVMMMRTLVPLVSKIGSPPRMPVAVPSSNDERRRRT